MGRKWWFIGLLIFMGFSATACATRTVYVRKAPPPPRVEVIVAKPYPNAIWIPGHWAWRSGRYVWVPGHWQKSRAGYVWVAGRWKKTNHGWVWVKGHWKRTG